MIIQLVSRSLPSGRCMLAALATSCGVSWAMPVWAEVPRSEQALVRAVEAAVRDGDSAALQALVNWEGVDPQSRGVAIRMLQHAASSEVISVKAAPLPSNFQPVTHVSGFKYSHNTDPQGLIQIQVKQPGTRQPLGLTLPFGRTGQGYFVSQTIRTRSDYAGPEDVAIVVTLSGAGAVVAGECSYFVSGQRRTLPFSGPASRSLSFWGQSIERCEARRTSPEGSIRLTVSMDGEEVYRSPDHRSADPLVYTGGAP